MSDKVQASVRDFEIEITHDGIGYTMQIIYNGRPSGGMSGFGGTLQNACRDLSDVLRKLADDVDSESKRPTLAKGES